MQSAFGEQNIWNQLRREKKMQPHREQGRERERERERASSIHFDWLMERWGEINDDTEAWTLIT